MNPLHRRILLISGGVLLLAAVVLTFSKDEKPDLPEKQETIAPRQTVSRPDRRPEITSPVIDPADVGNPGTPPAGSGGSFEEVSKEILFASTRYAPEGVPIIAPYLVDPDKKVRTAALEGMLNLGETGGAAELRKAAEKLEDPDEAAAYIKAAEYLELPSDNLIK